MVFDREKTGFEETKEFQIAVNTIVAGRYQIQEYLGSAAFSKAIQVGSDVRLRVVSRPSDGRTGLHEDNRE